MLAMEQNNIPIFDRESIICNIHFVFAPRCANAKFY